MFKIVLILPAPSKSVFFAWPSDVKPNTCNLRRRKMKLLKLRALDPWVKQYNALSHEISASGIFIIPNGESHIADCYISIISVSKKNNWLLLLLKFCWFVSLRVFTLKHWTVQAKHQKQKMIPLSDGLTGSQGDLQIQTRHKKLQRNGMGTVQNERSLNNSSIRHSFESTLHLYTYREKQKMPDFWANKPWDKCFGFKLGDRSSYFRWYQVKILNLTPRLRSQECPNATLAACPEVMRIFMEFSEEGLYHVDVLRLHHSTNHHQH